ncbi:MAG: hypothetical protein ACP5RM_02760 [Candidatus Micrarchaeia archaeon]
MKLNIGFVKKKSFNTNITALKLKWKGETHEAPGLKTNNRIFDVTIPFHNRRDETDMLKSILKSSVIESITVKKIEVAQPFKLVNVEPIVPHTIKYGDKVDFKLSIEAPAYSYSGPLEIEFVEDEPERVRIEINKIVLISGNKRVSIPNSEMAMSLRKSQIFKINVQLYKILSYGDNVSSIEAGVPFEFVSSIPGVPFKIDNKNSYVVTIFVKAPQMNYGGPLEILFK